MKGPAAFVWFSVLYLVLAYPDWEKEIKPRHKPGKRISILKEKIMSDTPLKSIGVVPEYPEGSTGVTGAGTVNGTLNTGYITPYQRRYHAV